MTASCIMANWKPVTVAELKVFFGLLFAMGLVVKPDIKSYWSTNAVSGTPFFGKIICRNRFDAIMMAFHLNDNTKTDNTKLYKVEPLFSYLQEKFASVYAPQQNVAVDESMVPWRGSISFRIFIPSKPMRFGMKLYMCCESESSYVSCMELYTGKKGDKREVDHGPNVVKRLVQRLGASYTVFVDSFFRSVTLFEQLRKEGITACGTIRKDRRGLPEELEQMKLKKGEASSLSKAIDTPPKQDGTPQTDGRLHAVKYNDKKEVVLLSRPACCTGQMINTGKKDRDDNAIVKPEAVHLCHQNMNGVDQFHQHL